MLIKSFLYPSLFLRDTHRRKNNEPEVDFVSPRRILKRISCNDYLSMSHAVAGTTLLDGKERSARESSLEGTVGPVRKPLFFL